MLEWALKAELEWGLKAELEWEWNMELEKDKEVASARKLGKGFSPIGMGDRVLGPFWRSKVTEQWMRRVLGESLD